ncbi:MAG TPA: hypothetical protein VIX73_35885 [Kofleriaceae bacterium]|jgi:hypothetical protein
MLAATPEPTLHYRVRAAERGLSPDIELFLKIWGTEIWAAGARQITLLRKHLPEELQDTMIARRAEDWILVLAPNGALMTCYERRNAWRFVHRKADDRRPRKSRGRRSRRR